MLVIARKLFFAALAFFTFATLGGCQLPAQSEGPTCITMHISDREAFFDDALTVLRSKDFTPDFVDRQRGLIVTKPSTSKQWFEFWRIDSVGAYQLAESSLHTVRRSITVNCAPTDPDNPNSDSLVSVQVDKERYSAPERQVTTASGAFAIYSEKLPTTEGLAAARSAGEHWTPLGRDVLLEQKLLDVFSNLSPAVPESSDSPPPSAKPEDHQNS